MRRCLLTSLLLLALAAPAFAQKNPKLVPFDVAQSLIAASSRGRPDILVGELPARVAERVPLPPNTRVLGSADYGVRSVNVLATDLPVNVARDQMSAALLARGWKHPPAQDVGGGFMSTPSDQGDVFCAPDSVMVEITAGRQVSGETRVLVLEGKNEYTPCSAPRNYPLRQESVIPALVPMRGWTTWPRHSGGGGDQWHSQVFIQTTSSLADVAKHYVDQLTASGWSVVRTLAGEGITATTFAFKDKDGRDWTATMLTSTSTLRWPVLVEIRALRITEGM